MDLRHDLHQPLRADAAFRVRVEAGFDRHHRQQQQRIEADVAAGLERRLDELAERLLRDPVAARQVGGDERLFTVRRERAIVTGVGRNPLGRNQFRERDRRRAVAGRIGRIVLRGGFRRDVETDGERVRFGRVFLLRLRAGGREVRQRMAGQQTGRTGLHGRGYDRHQLCCEVPAHGRHEPEGERNCDSETADNAE